MPRPPSFSHHGIANLARIAGFWRRRHASGWLALIGAVLCLFAALAQAADPAVITFSLDFPHSDPSHYSITVNDDGHAVYQCSARISAESEDTEDYKYTFSLSPSTRARIFELASQAHYFSGKPEPANRKLAFTGSKKLTYSDGQRNSSVEYNYSTQLPVQQLTEIFQRISGTMDFARRLDHEHHFQKLALEDELKRMESEAHENQLAEIQAINPILQAIVDDNSVMNVVRARAQRLMQVGKTPDR